MPKTPSLRVSVIIPTRNEEKLLPGCLASLTKQTPKSSCEIIVVDTNSTDKTVSIAKSFGVIVIEEPRRGKVYAFQKGALAAKNDILCFTEADCILPAHWIQTITDHFAAHKKAGAIVGEYSFHSSTGIFRFLAFIFHPIGRICAQLFFGYPLLRASNFAIRKKVYHQSGGFWESRQEMYDVDLSKRAIKYGDIHFVPKMNIETSDRRFKNRQLPFLKEFVHAFFVVGVLNRPLQATTYKDIR